MAKPYPSGPVIIAEFLADHLDERDEQEVMRALITTGAFVSLADGRVEAAERNELVRFLDEQRIVPMMSKRDIGEMFDGRVRQFARADSKRKIEMMLKVLRSLTGRSRSLSSIVVRTAERVAAADRHIHPKEVLAIELIRLTLSNLQTQRNGARSHD
jgi:tellurite resistance protein